MEKSKELCREYSYRALKRGNLNVALLPIKNDIKTEADIVNIEDDKKVLIGVKVLKNGTFSMTNKEYQTMRAYSKEENAEYLIHAYKLRGEETISFDIYKYDSEKDKLISTLHGNKGCTITEKIIRDQDGLPRKIYECRETKVKKLLLVDE